MRDKLITVAGIVILVGIVLAINRHFRQDGNPAIPSNVRDFSGEAVAQDEEGKRLVATVETNKGTFSFELFPEDAPGTVENFVKLARKGFYDGTIFHRVVPGFVIQGGDPTGTGSGGPGYTIKAEFNKRKHVAGTVAMARSAHPDSAGSQFYVCLAPTPHLDGSYTVFGQVIEGMDVVQAIGKTPTKQSRPVEKIVMNKVTIKEEPAKAK
jgi:cyclophilin family peptidyl-prolyl cis-trans isomerase